MKKLITYRKARNKRGGRHLIKCSCGCGNKFELYLNDDFPGSEIEISGVMMEKDTLIELLKG